MRTFVSINIPEKVKKEIEKIQDKLPEFYGKKTEFENLHLTLKFLGEIDEKKVELVKKKLKEIKFEKFETEIDSLGFFDNRKSKKYQQKIIIWLHMKDCEGLQKEIDEKLKDLFKPEERFMSHLTIARVKSVKDKRKFLEELKKIKIPALKFNVDCFYLMKSELDTKGSKYSVVEKYDLN